MKYVSPEYQKAIQLHQAPRDPNKCTQRNTKFRRSRPTRLATRVHGPGVSFSDPSGIQTGVNDITEASLVGAELLAAHREAEVSK